MRDASPTQPIRAAADPPEAPMTAAYARLEHHLAEPGFVARTDARTSIGPDEAIRRREACARAGRIRTEPQAAMPPKRVR